jgi:thioredoxin-like negative regulator of GroEL
MTATIGLTASWVQMQNEKTCPVTIKTVYVNATANATTKNATTKNATTAAKKSTPTPTKIATPVPTATPVVTQTKTLVFLYMSNCPYCDQMKPIINDLIAKSCSVTQIDTDSDPGAWVRYNASSAPTIIVLQNGKEVQRFVGVVDEQTLLNALK